MNIKKLKKFREEAIDAYKIHPFEDGFIVAGRYGWRYNGIIPTALNERDVMVDLIKRRRQCVLAICREERLTKKAKLLNKQTR